MDDAQLRTVWQQRQFSGSSVPVGQPLELLMKHVLGKRVRQLGKLSRVWDECIPRTIRDHTALESYRNGVLTVMVDSATARYQLQTLLTGGMMKEIRGRFTSPLNKIRVVPGQFYSVDLSGATRYNF